MPKIDLIGFFNDLFNEPFDDYEQRTYYLEKSPYLCFTDDQGIIVNHYQNLQDLNLTPAELEALKSQPDPKLNEPQILAKALTYDETENKIFIKAVKCDYKFLVSFGSGKVFDTSSPIYQEKFYKIGSIAALITNDFKTVIVERNEPSKRFSSFSGLLKHEISQYENIAVTTAIEESQEEFFNHATHIKIKEDEGKIGALSLRKGNFISKLCSIDFIIDLPIDTNESDLKSSLDKYLTKSLKPDMTSDHTGRYKIINPGTILEKDLVIIEENLSVKKIRDQSSSLVDPIITSVCKFLELSFPQFIQKESLNDLINNRKRQANEYDTSSRKKPAIISDDFSSENYIAQLSSDPDQQKKEIQSIYAHNKQFTLQQNQVRENYMLSSSSYNMEFATSATIEGEGVCINPDHLDANASDLGMSLTGTAILVQMLFLRSSYN